MAVITNMSFISGKNIDPGNIEERRESARKLPYNFTHFMRVSNSEHLAPNVDSLAWKGVRLVL